MENFKKLCLMNFCTSCTKKGLAQFFSAPSSQIFELLYMTDRQFQLIFQKQQKNAFLLYSEFNHNNDYWQHFFDNFIHFRKSKCLCNYFANKR